MADSTDRARGPPAQFEPSRSAEYEPRRVTEEIWHEKKKILEDMYIIQNLSLPIVKQRMEQDYGLKATCVAEVSWRADAHFINRKGLQLRLFWQQTDVPASVPEMGLA